jgi:hypothetical protein
VTGAITEVHFCLDLVSLHSDFLFCISWFGSRNSHFSLICRRPMDWKADQGTEDEGGIRPASSVS